MRIGFISDIHEDVLRLKEAIGILEGRCDRIVCLGDIVGYTVPYYGFLASRNAHECVQLVKGHCDIAVIGNHDLAAIGKLPEHTAGLRYPNGFYSLEPLKRMRLAKELRVWSYENDLPALIDKGDIRFLSGLPEQRVETFDHVRVFISHYAYPDLVGNLARDITDPEDTLEHIRFQAKNRCMFGISGHDHTEGIWVFDKKQVNKVRFGVRTKIPENSWATCPGVANGVFANGVAMLDTENSEVIAIPLKTRKHRRPAWGKR